MEERRRRDLEAFFFYCVLFNELLDELKPYSSKEQLKKILKLQKRVSKTAKENENVLREKIISVKHVQYQKNEYKDMNKRFDSLVGDYRPIIIRDLIIRKFSFTLAIYKFNYGFL